MKIGIYLEYLYTGGGGERYTCTIAEYLSQSHEVFLITKHPVDIAYLEKRLNLDLSRTKLVYWPNADQDYLSNLTQEYDVFINATIFSSLRNQARYGIALTFFPTVLNFNYPIIVKKLILYLLGFIFKSRNASVYQVSKYKQPSLYDWEIVEPEFAMIANRDIKQLQLILAESRYDAKNIIESIQINGNHTKFKVVNNNALLIEDQLQKGDVITVSLNSKADLFANQVSNSHNPLSLQIKSIKFKTTSGWINVVGNLVSRNDLVGKIFKKMSDIYEKQKASLEAIQYFDSYNLIWSISKYTEEWIQKIYNKNSRILYPPIDTNQYQPGVKENIILAVGRFFPEKFGHNKKQHMLVKFFKQAYDTHSEFKKYKLYLCGGLSDDPLHKEYLEECTKLAPGYPIELIPNTSFDQLKDLYGKAKIFWHAAGYNEDLRSPELFEHFGMTTVEAMSAGAVPVVVNAGGQKEIIDEGKDGFVWDTPDELIDRTSKLMNNKPLLERISAAAISKSQQYSKDKMIEQVERDFKDLLSDNT